MTTIRLKVIVVCLFWFHLVTPHSRAQSATPEVLVEDFIKAWNAHEAKGFEMLFTGDAIWVPVAEVRHEGRDTIVRDFMVAHTGWAQSTTIALKGAPTHRMPRPDVATVFFHVQFADKGQPVTGIERAVIIVAVKEADGWRICAGQLTKESAPR